MQELVKRGMAPYSYTAVFDYFLPGIFALGFLYFLFGELGLLVQSSQSGLTLIWPPSGIAFAILYLKKYSCGLAF